MTDLLNDVGNFGGKGSEVGNALQIDALQRELDSVRTELAAFRDKVRTVAIERAKEHEWCSVIDDILYELNLEGRDKDFWVRIKVSYQTSVRVTARGTAEAMDKVGDLDLVPNLRITSPFNHAGIEDPYAHEFKVEAVDADVADD